MSNRDKARYIERAAEEFVVLSEVGYKDNDRCLQLSGEDWIRCINEDLSAGATRVITEARESGKSGICRPDGTLRFDLVERILGERDRPQPPACSRPRPRSCNRTS